MLQIDRFRLPIKDERIITNGTIDWVKLDISDDVEEDAEMYFNAKMRRH